MKDFLIYLLCGLSAGIPGGMGMGGGTLLIPILTIFCNVEQRLSQEANLVSFIPMAIIAVIIHFKNGLVKKQGLLTLILPALIFAIGGGLITKFIDSQILKRIFGGFLIATSVFAFLADKLKIGVNKAKNEEN